MYKLLYLYRRVLENDVDTVKRIKNKVIILEGITRLEGLRLHITCFLLYFNTCWVI